MLHILLLILKILLWILLGILGLVLLIVLLVLFAPIHYRAGVKFDGKALVKAKVRFLFVSFAVEFSQEEKKLSKAIRIAGIRLGGKGDKEADSGISHDAGNLPEETQPHEPATGKSATDEAVEGEIVDIKPVESEPMADKKAVDDATADKPDDAGIKNQTDEEKKPSVLDKIKNIALKVKDIWAKISPENVMDTIDAKSDEISKKYNGLEKKARRYKKLWELECTVKTRNYLKKYIPSIFRHISPRRVRGYVRYGFGDPAKTGQITGYISLLPFVYQKGFSLRPDFYDKVIEADVDLKGHIMLGYILRIALKPYLWRTVKVVRKVKAQNK
jgi:hypothetical protein